MPDFPGEHFYAPLSYETLLFMFADMIQASGDESKSIPREMLIAEINRLSVVNAQQQKGRNDE